MTPWCDDLVCSWRRLLADRHSLPFPWTLSLHRRWCPSASHHPLTVLFLRALTFPLPFPFPSLGLSLRRPQCPSASPPSFPSHSLGRLCQRSPRTCPVSLLCVESTQRKANAFAVGQVRPSTWPTWPGGGGDIRKLFLGGKMNFTEDSRNWRSIRGTQTVFLASAPHTQPASPRGWGFFLPLSRGLKQTQPRHPRLDHTILRSRPEEHSPTPSGTRAVPHSSASQPCGSSTWGPLCRSPAGPSPRS